MFGEEWIWLFKFDGKCQKINKFKKE